MKPYLLFSWPDYEASGGPDDFMDVYATIDEAKAAFGGEQGAIATFDGSAFRVICRYVSRTDGKRNFTGWDDDPSNPFRNN